MLVALLVAGARTGGGFIGGRAFNESEVVMKRQCMHQGRENIASRPLKIIAISVIFCGNLHKK
jgi:hypothetical protein